MKQAEQMQERLQSELEELSIEASVGGGMVTATMNGKKQLAEITIDPEVIDPEDPGMLQDLIVAAVNEATRQVDDAVQERLGGMMPGLGGLGSLMS